MRAQPRTCLSLGRCGGNGANSGILREPVESFITPQLSFHPIEGILLCQTSAQSFGGFATMTGGVFQFVIQLFVGDVDSFLGSDAIDDQFRFHIVGSAFLLAAAQRAPTNVSSSPLSPPSLRRARHPLS